MRYILKNLFDCPIIEAFGALKKVESLDTFFTSCDTVLNVTAPTLLGLRFPQTPPERESIKTTLQSSETALLAIGAIPLVLRAESVIKACRENNQPQIEATLGDLRRATEDLFAYIDGSRAELDNIKNTGKSEIEVNLLDGLPSFDETPAADTTPSAHAPLIVDNFKRLAFLLENGEAAAAISITQKLIDSHFDTNIAQPLNTIYKAISTTNIEEATAEAKQLVPVVIDYSALTKGLPKKMVLAIDDMPDILKTLKLMLRNTYTVFGALSPETALKYLVNNAIDAMILDIEMPEMDGFTLFRLVKRTPLLAKIPALFLTGNANANNVYKSHDVGGDDFIKKPVNAALLLPRLEKLLSDK